MASQDFFSFLLFFLQIVIALKTFQLVQESKDDKDKQEERKKSQQNENTQKSDAAVQQQPEKNQNLQQQLQQNQNSLSHANQASSKPTFIHLDNDTHSRQRTDSFCLPTQNGNKSRKNSEYIPQTPAFLPEKIKKPLFNQLQGFNTQSQNQKSFVYRSNSNIYGVSLEIDSISNETNNEDSQCQPTFKQSISMKEIIKAETPEKKKLLQQQKIQIEGVNYSNNQQINNKNLIQSPNSNFNSRYTKQFHTSEDRNIREPNSKQDDKFRQKEFDRYKNDSLIRENNWIKFNNLSRKPEEQDISIQGRGQIAPFNRMDKFDQNNINRKRHHIIDNYAHASDSDDMELEKNDKKYSVNKIFEIQKRKLLSRQQQQSEEKLIERKNQACFNAPYSHNLSTLIAINHRDQEKIEMEDFIKDQSKIQNKDNNPKEYDSKQNLDKQSNNITQQSSSSQLGKQPGINITIPAKSNQNVLENQVENGKGKDIFNQQSNTSSVIKSGQSQGVESNLVNQIQTNQTVSQSNALPQTTLSASTGLFANINPKNDKTASLSVSNNQSVVNNLTPSETLKTISQPQESQKDLLGSLTTKQQNLNDKLSVSKVPPQPDESVKVSTGLFQNVKQTENSEQNAGGLFSQQQILPQTNMNHTVSVTAAINILHPPLELQQTEIPPKNNLLASNVNKQKEEEISKKSENLLFTSIAASQIQENSIRAPLQSEKPLFINSTESKSSSLGLFSQQNHNQNQNGIGLFVNSIIKPEGVEEQKITSTINQYGNQQNEQIQKQSEQSASSLEIKKPCILQEPISKTEEKPLTFDSGRVFVQKKNGEDQKSITTGLFSNLSQSSQTSGIFQKKEDSQAGEDKNPLSGTLFRSSSSANAFSNINPAISISQPSSNLSKTTTLFENKQEITQNDSLKQYNKGSETGLFGNISTQPINSENQKEKNTKNIFGQSISIPSTNGGLFNTEQANPLKDKIKQSIEFSPLPPKIIEDNANGQLFTELEPKNQEKPFTQNSLTFGNSDQQQKSQPDIKSQSLFSNDPKKLEGQGLFFNSSNQQPNSTGLFAKISQPLANQNNQEKDNQKDQGKGLFSNLQPSVTSALLGKPVSLFQNQANTSANNSIFGSGTGLFSNAVTSSSSLSTQQQTIL